MVTKLQYEVVERNNCIELVNVVNLYLQVGWQLLGGVTVSPHGTWAQAMTKEDK